MVSEVHGENSQTFFFIFCSFHPLDTEHEYMAQLHFEKLLFSVFDNKNSKKTVCRGLNRASPWSKWGDLTCVHVSYWELLQLATDA